MMRRQVGWFFAFTTMAGAVQAQNIGPEFRVNSVTEGFQYQPSIAADALGNFVVVWASDNVDGEGTAIVGRRYNAMGTPLGGEFVVSTFTPGYQAQPTVAMNASGAFVVAWQSYDQLGQEGEIFGQRFDAAGARVGGEFLVNSFTPYNQRDPDVALGPAGEFVVAWVNYGAAYPTVVGQRFDSGGNRVGGEFPVSSVVDYQLSPAVAMLPSGFVVAWDASPEGMDPNGGVLARLFAADGSPIDAEFAVNTHTTNDQVLPDVAADAAGNFIVVWEGWGQDEMPGSPDPGIFAQRFEADGDRIGGEFRVNTYTTYAQSNPAVARNAGGDFVVTWDSLSDGYPDVLAQRYTASGTRVGPEFRVNSYTTYEQVAPVIAALGAPANFVVAWTSFGQDGSSAGVYAQRLSDVIFQDGFE
jgi:hypothetical protein